jgi:hypothetical protein
MKVFVVTQIIYGNVKIIAVFNDYQKAFQYSLLRQTKIETLNLDCEIVVSPWNVQE